MLKQNKTKIATKNTQNVRKSEWYKLVPLGYPFVSFCSLLGNLQSNVLAFIPLTQLAKCESMCHRKSVVDSSQAYLMPILLISIVIPIT